MSSLLDDASSVACILSVNCDPSSVTDMLSVNFVFLQSEPEVEYLADVDFDESDLSDVEVSKPLCSGNTTLYISTYTDVTSQRSHAGISTRIVSCVVSRVCFRDIQGLGGGESSSDESDDEDTVKPSTSRKQRRSSSSAAAAAASSARKRKRPKVNIEYEHEFEQNERERVKETVT